MNKLLLIVIIFFLISFQVDNTYSFINLKPSNEIYIIKGVYFNFGSAELQPEGEYDLKKVSAGMKTLTDIKIEITPYLDSIEFNKFGKKLATQRLIVVNDFLSKEGISVSRIVNREFQNKFLSPNNSEEERYLNRCVTMTVID